MFRIRIEGNYIIQFVTFDLHTFDFPLGSSDPPKDKKKEKKEKL